VRHRSTTFGFGQFFGVPEFRRDAGGFSLARILATRPGDRMPEHTHDTAHLVLVLSGHYLTSGEPTEPGRTATVVYNPPGVTHADRFAQGGGVFFSLSISDRSLERAGASRLPARPLAFASGPAVRIARRLYRIGAAWPCRSQVRAEAAGMDLLAAMLDDAAASRPSVPSWLASVRDMLASRFDEPVRLDAVAANAGVHPVHLIRVFRRFYDVTPHAFLFERRLEAAAAMLVATEHPIVDVALGTGWADQSHFTHAFSRRYGVSPAAFRRRGPVAPRQNAR
jgi:AraC family transcriptional regulator